MKTHTRDDRNEVIIELLSQIENYKAALGKITGDINHHKNMLEAIAFAEKIIALLSQDNAEDIAAAYTKLDIFSQINNNRPWIPLTMFGLPPQTDTWVEVRGYSNMTSPKYFLCLARLNLKKYSSGNPCWEDVNRDPLSDYGWVPTEWRQADPDMKT